MGREHQSRNLTHIFQPRTTKVCPKSHFYWEFCALYTVNPVWTRFAPEAGPGPINQPPSIKPWSFPRFRRRSAWPNDLSSDPAIRWARTAIRKLLRPNRWLSGMPRPGMLRSAAAIWPANGRPDKEILPRDNRCSDAVKKEQSRKRSDTSRIPLGQRRQLPKQNGLHQKGDRHREAVAEQEVPVASHRSHHIEALRFHCFEYSDFLGAVPGRATLRRCAPRS